VSRKLAPSSSPVAPVVGLSKAVRVGNFISVGGTAPIDDTGKTVGINDPAEQTRRHLETIESALEHVGASMKNVVRTGMLLTRIEDRGHVAKVRCVYFKDILPVDTVMQVTKVINPERLIEIEVDAVIDED
jgi:enamine deaminase RidA (YjgF/YER057c/UK114 family)